MIISAHVTHSSVGGIESLNRIVPLLEEKASSFLSSMDSVTEFVIIRTCNRFEVYAASDDPAASAESLEKLLKSAVPSSGISYILQGDESIRHLFRVVCGLDSLIVGEDQIQHQVRECYAKAKDEGHVGPMLSRLFDKSMVVGKRVRSETALNKGAVSVGSASVELAESKIGPLDGKSVTILGAGDMASVIAKNLVRKNIGAVFVSNRTYSHALELASELGGTAVSMDLMDGALADTDLVLVATSAPHTVLHKPAIEKAMEGRKDRKMLIIDVSVPRNVDEDVAEIPGVELDTMDSLQSIAAENVRRRTEEINSAEKIIRQELAKVDAERRESLANEIIRQISINIADIRSKEMERAIVRYPTESFEDLIDDFSRALVNKITAPVYNSLREASREGRSEICSSAAELFGLR